MRRMGEEIGEDDLDRIPALRSQLEAELASLEKSRAA